MRRAYVVVGITNAYVPDVWYAVAHSIARAEELCYEAENEDSAHIYTWREVIEEDD